MFHRLGHVTYRRRRLVLALAGLFLAFGAVWGTGVFGSMVSSGFDTPAASRPRAGPHRGRPSAVARPTSSSSTATGADRSADPAFRAAVEDHLADLPDRPGGVHDDVLDGGAGRPALRVRRTARSTYAVLQLVGATTTP